MCVSAARPKLPIQQIPLQGLTGAYLLMEELPSDARRAGLSQEGLRTAVELQLRRAGLRLVSKDAGAPTVYVNLNMIRDRDLPLLIYSLKVEVMEGVTLERDRSIFATATTWQKGTLGFVGENRVGQLRQELIELVDALANDILAANQQ